MNAIVTSMGGPIVSFALIFLLGFILSHFGKPYGALLFNAHKLAALAFGVFLLVKVYRVNQAAGLTGLEIGLITLCVLLFLSLAVLGGLLSIEKSMPAVVRLLHHVLPYLAAISTLALGFMLNHP